MAVLDRLSNRWQLNKRREIYECATIQTSNGRQMNVTVARCLAQGNLESSIVTSQLLEEVKPRWILLVGIAGGVPANEFSLGDVLIASRYLDFSVTGAIEGARVEQNVSGGGFHSDVEKLLKHLPADRDALTGWSSTESLNQSFPPLAIPSAVGDPLLYGDDKWQSTVLNSLQHHFGSGPRPPQTHIGPTGSANVLMKDTELTRQWLSTARSIVNVEMELAGVYKACCAYNSELPKLLAIRGISDVIGYKRSHEWLNYACHSAAAFSISMIQAGLLQNTEDV
jgi:nucleoside phosphorylase